MNLTQKVATVINEKGVSCGRTFILKLLPEPRVDC